MPDVPWQLYDTSEIMCQFLTTGRQTGVACTISLCCQNQVQLKLLPPQVGLVSAWFLYVLQTMQLPHMHVLRISGRGCARHGPSMRDLGKHNAGICKRGRACRFGLCALHLMCAP